MHQNGHSICVILNRHLWEKHTPLHREHTTTLRHACHGLNNYQWSINRTLRGHNRINITLDHTALPKRKGSWQVQYEYPTSAHKSRNDSGTYLQYAHRNTQSASAYTWPKASAWHHIHATKLNTRITCTIHHASISIYRNTYTKFARTKQTRASDSTHKSYETKDIWFALHDQHTKSARDSKNNLKNKLKFNEQKSQTLALARASKSNLKGEYS